MPTLTSHEKAQQMNAERGAEELDKALTHLANAQTYLRAAGYTGAAGDVHEAMAQLRWRWAVVEKDVLRARRESV